MPKLPYVFFGAPDFAVSVLGELEDASMLPELIVTSPDRKSGRGQTLSPSPVGQFAACHSIKTLKPTEINQQFYDNLRESAPDGGWPVFVVVAYGQILPEKLIYLPEHNTLNLHPSLLPRQRGAAPIRGAILEENETGVTIMELDEKMDHGPIVTQKKVAVDNWPPRYDQLAPRLAHAGGQLLAETLPDWVAGSIEAQPQKHELATYSEKFTSSDGEIDLGDDPHKNYRKIQAFSDWPKAHFLKNDRRILITKAHLEDGELVIDRVKPAGEDEVDYKKFSNQ